MADYGMWTERDHIDDQIERLTNEKDEAESRWQALMNTNIDLIAERERLMKFRDVVESRLECPCPWCGDCIEDICEALEETKSGATRGSA